MKKVRSYLPTTEHALVAFGAQIAVARRERGWTATDLAERLGVGTPLVSKIEHGVPGTAIGTVFEAAVLCGVPLFSVDPADLEDLAIRERQRLALLPARIRRERIQISDDF